jgi:flavin-dependent dehydrogenase
MRASATGPAWDVAVVGGGPAGAATARRLATAGRSVVLLERSRYDGTRVGETLAPWVCEPLRSLGVWDRFRALGPVPSWGTRSVWAAPAPDDHAHLLGTHGPGWHVDRCAFDRMLADAAANAGADVLTGWTVDHCSTDAAGWRVRSTNGRTVRARVLVDATGRRAGPGRSLGASRESFDRLVAVAGGWSSVDVASEQYLLVEAADQGWWYTAPVPGAARVGMLLTDADLCRNLGLADAAAWHSALLTTRATAQRVRGQPPSGRLRVHPAGSSRLVRHGDSRPWLAVGDAALAVDPLSGSGVARALRMAESAADTILAMLTKPIREPIRDYEAARDDECTEYLTERAGQYGVVRRFRTPFWTRRQLIASA